MSRFEAGAIRPLRHAHLFQPTRQEKKDSQKMNNDGAEKRDHVRLKIKGTGSRQQVLHCFSYGSTKMMRQDDFMKRTPSGKVQRRSSISALDVSFANKGSENTSNLFLIYDPRAWPLKSLYSQQRNSCQPASKQWAMIARAELT